MPVLVRPDVHTDADCDWALHRKFGQPSQRARLLGCLDDTGPRLLFEMCVD